MHSNFYVAVATVVPVLLLSSSLSLFLRPTQPIDKSDAVFTRIFMWVAAAIAFLGAFAFVLSLAALAGGASYNAFIEVCMIIVATLLAGLNVAAIVLPVIGEHRKLSRYISTGQMQ